MKLRRVDGDSADFIPSLPETVADEDSETEHQIRVLQAKFRFVLSIRARYFFEFLVFTGSMDSENSPGCFVAGKCGLGTRSGPEESEQRSKLSSYDQKATSGEYHHTPVR